ncbi:MAG TPA: 23S rRNA (uridine(2552)-2'-O)-methyltransferase RlmE [Steroidobacteraceae bacterium]
MHAAIVRIGKMARRSKSSSRWLNEHFADPFVRQAQAQGWRSRAVFKLEEIDRREKLLRPAQLCLDLGAAPGAWSQYARRRLGAKGRLIATDMLPMEPLAGVEFVQGDFREAAVFDNILELLPPRQVDVVLSDMAPNFSGLGVVDQPRSMYLAELALDFAQRVLKPHGAALIKVFQGAGFQELIGATRRNFAAVRLCKPHASRSRSPEMYLLAKDFLMV